MHLVSVKGILSAQNGMNLYRGCSHGCIYCDSRSKCYQMQHDFEDIAVKQNAIELLEDALKRKRSRCMISTGAMSDPYIPAEMQLRYTRQALTLIEQYGFGCAIQTKSDRILRDIDLLQSIHQKAKCVVEMTLTTCDDNLCRILEPNVCVTSRRFAVLKAMQKAGIPTIVWLCPILPFINDTRENILGILEYCIDAGVKGVICFNMGLTLREGNREHYYAQLDRYFPGLKERYIRTYGNAYEIPSPNNTALMQLFHQVCERYGMMHDINQIFAYLHEFELKDGQIGFGEI